MYRLNLILILLIIGIVVSFTPGVYALSLSLGQLTTGSVYTTSPNLITITLSDPCLTLVRHNQSSPECPTYKQILKYDNSNPLISGKFVNTFGYLHRQPIKTTNDWGMYNPSKLLVLLDPSYSDIVHSKEIILVPSLNYIIKDQTVGSNHTRLEYHDRYVYPDCSGAEIVYSDFLLNDTIKYLQSICTKTDYNEQTVKSTPHKTPLDLTNPYSSLKLQSQLKIIFNGKSQLYNENMPTSGGLGPGNCINGCTFTTSSKKAGY